MSQVFEGGRCVWSEISVSRGRYALKKALFTDSYTSNDDVVGAVSIEKSQIQVEMYMHSFPALSVVAHAHLGLQPA